MADMIEPAMTVGDLKAALVGIPDELPVEVYFDSGFGHNSLCEACLSEDGTEFIVETY